MKTRVRQDRRPFDVVLELLIGAMKTREDTNEGYTGRGWNSS
ncbi:hypothetical protein [Actinoalloteichus hoggarensis]|nr:hypothetical protein [Actinoalloteichus hoggarensis]